MCISTPSRWGLLCNGAGGAALCRDRGPAGGARSKALSRLGKPEALQIVYEAGPCGYTLVRQVRARGYACEVIASEKIARQPGDRIKTDRLDALLLARAARAGELVSVTIPDEHDLALRGIDLLAALTLVAEIGDFTRCAATGTDGISGTGTV